MKLLIASLGSVLLSVFSISSMERVDRALQCAHSTDGRKEWEGNTPKDLQRGSFATDLKTVCKGLRRIIKRDEPPIAPDWVQDEQVIERSDAPCITWVGHATIFLQSARVNFVIDPFWGDYDCGPVTLFKRLMPAIPPLEKMPSVDCIMLSHRHADHCDEHALRYFVQRNPECRALVPQGNASFFTKLGFKKENITECQWGDVVTLGDEGAATKCTFLPAAHDADEHSLWGSWHIKIGNVTLFHAGDTGRDAPFEKMPQSQIALLPIAPYTFRALQQPAHIDPNEAVEAFKKVAPNGILIPIHWATLPYCDDDPQENVAELKKALAEKNISEAQLRVLKFGERVWLSDLVKK
jgi:L-ascorbate metabolism protein UlaG (beta-lactamase superfamily)